MSLLFQFGESVEGYSVKVINEREARGSAGIFFALAFFSFIYAISFHDFRYTQIFVTLFFVDFFIRVIINPRYSPSMILARFAVRGMKPEYVGAPQKHFAWSIGLVLATLMTYFIWEGVMLPEVKIPICILCLFLFFFETAFGICIGCKLYNLIYKDKAQHCPGESCEIQQKEPIQHINLLQTVILLVTITVVSYFTYQSTVELQTQKKDSSISKSLDSKCGAGKCGAGKCGGM